MDTGLKRTFDAEFINGVLNHPDVKDGSETYDGFDVTELVNNAANVILINDFGGFIYTGLGNGMYEVHSQFLPEGRGVKAYHAAVESVRWMFVNTDCIRIISKAKPENEGACQLADKVLGRKGFNGVYNYYSLEYMAWVETDKEAKKKGELFHEMVEGVTNHDDDDTHDYHVGGALLICEAGNPLKAQQVYNYWAIASGYELCDIEATHPLLLRVGDMRIKFPLEVI